MYPSEKVWKGISKSLHTRRRWFGLGALLLLISGGFVTMMMLNPSEKSVATNQAITTQPVSNDKSTSINNFVAPKLNDHSSSLIAESNNISSPEAFITRVPDVNDSRNNNSETISSVSENSTNVPAERLNETVFTSVAGSNSNTVSETSAPFIPVVQDEIADQDEFAQGPAAVPVRKAQPSLLSRIDALPYTIESVINSYRRKQSRLSMQLYFTPTVSYRKLTTNKDFVRPEMNPSIPYSSIASTADVNNVVTHKPLIGLELGLAAKYPISKNVKVRAGFQFNMSRYDIRAFNNPVEVATIAFTSDNLPDSFNTASSYRNLSGKNPSWLENFYFQVSAPVGLELKVAGDENVQFGIAGTIQPTYMLGDRAYMLSTDYKNYAEVPWLVRRWNVNTSLETFVAYSTGKIKWQVGPQVRYQLHSTFVEKYPVKENLFDFGLKVGVSLNNQ